MIDLKKIGPFKRQRPSTVLALALDGSKLDGVVVRRTNGSVQLLQSFSTTLTLDPMTADPELVGREIRNQLDAAEVRERNCVVCLPLKWAMTTHIEVPQLPEADVPGFLQLEAERGFHSDTETLFFGTSRYSLAGKQNATLVGIPRNHVVIIENVLQTAKLKPLSFSLGITALQRPGAETSDGVMALVIGETNVGLQITCAGGVAALRTLEGTIEDESGRRVLHADVVIREARITFGQLPGELREKVRTVRIFGPRDLAQQLADELELRLEQLALKVEVVKNYLPGEFGVQLPADAAVSPAFSFAATYLAGTDAVLEFLPPKIPAWQQFASKYGSGKARQGVIAAAALVVILLALFLYQQIQLSLWKSRWNAMSTRVGELDAISANVQKYQPWYDRNFRGLQIMKQITTAFPEDGTVTAKTLEIRDLNTVVCNGVARSMQYLLSTEERLQGTSGIAAVKLSQVRGRAPALQFTLNIQYTGGVGAN
ncbi:MAG TPA: hypothetical protein VKV04_19185 [Verrucomicrobiae bacterium]|nr:hypothetical protein [Verrucomicrobiae bacterium]